MFDNHPIDFNNATESSIISLIITFIWTVFMPWALQTTATLLSAPFVAFCIYHFNKWMKEYYEKKDALKKIKKLKEQEERQNKIKVII